MQWGRRSVQPLGAQPSRCRQQQRGGVCAPLTRARRDAGVRAGSPTEEKRAIAANSWCGPPAPLSLAKPTRARSTVAVAAAAAGRARCFLPWRWGGAAAGRAAPTLPAPAALHPLLVNRRLWGGLLGHNDNAQLSLAPSPLRLHALLLSLGQRVVPIPREQHLTLRPAPAAAGRRRARRRALGSFAPDVAALPPCSLSRPLSSSSPLFQRLPLRQQPNCWLDRSSVCLARRPLTPSRFSWRGLVLPSPLTALGALPPPPPLLLLLLRRLTIDAPRGRAPLIRASVCSAACMGVGRVCLDGGRFAREGFGLSNATKRPSTEKARPAQGALSNGPRPTTLSSSSALLLKH